MIDSGKRQGRQWPRQWRRDSTRTEFRGRMGDEFELGAERGKRLDR
jgi:hypothetical protein